MRSISATGSAPGFTLLELMIVLALLVLLASAWPLAAPRLFPAQQLRNEGERLVSVLRAARLKATVTGAVQEVTIASDGGGYARRDQSYRLPEGMRLDCSDRLLGRPQSPVQFFADGSSDGSSLTLSRANTRLTIRIAIMTGRAEIEL